MLLQYINIATAQKDMNTIYYCRYKPFKLVKLLVD